MTKHFKYHILGYLILATFFSLITSVVSFIILSFFNFFTHLSSIMRFVVCTAIFVLILVITFTQLLDLSLAYLQKINQALKNISNGQFDTRIELQGNDELTSMAQTINAMAEALKESEERNHQSRLQETQYHEIIHEEEKAKQALIMNVAHDLRTPLTSIIGYMQLLMDHPEYNDEQKYKYLKISYDKALRLSSLMDDLFDYTTLTTKYSKDNFTYLNISQLIEQVVDEMYPHFEAHHCKCHLHISNHQLFIHGDGILLFRVFDNLINNALKYKDDLSDIDIEVLDHDSLITIKVTNQGPVIPKEEIKHLFDQFYRSDASRSSKSGGTGLGLSIAKSIVEMHGGEIFALSKNNHTSFIIVFKKSFSS